MRPSLRASAPLKSAVQQPAAPITRAPCLKTALNALRSEPSYAARYRSPVSDPAETLLRVHHGSVSHGWGDDEVDAAAAEGRQQEPKGSYQEIPDAQPPQVAAAGKATSRLASLKTTQGVRGAPPLKSRSSPVSGIQPLMTSAKASSSSSSSAASSQGSGDDNKPTSPGDAASTSTSPSTSRAFGGGQDDEASTWAFGGGPSSRTGARNMPSFLISSSSSRQDAAAPSNQDQRKASGSYMVQGSAGKGAVPGYGKRKGTVSRSGRDDRLTAAHDVSTDADRRIAAGYTHDYAPTSRSPRPMPHHTYFSHPSSSFNVGASNAAGVLPGHSTHAARGSQSPIHGLGSSSFSAHGLKRKKTALIMPGQGSQYVAMCRDVYQAFRSARTVWHDAEDALVATRNSRYYPESAETAESEEQRELFEKELEKSVAWDRERGLAGSGTAIGRGRRGWLRDLVFGGDQLDLTRAENAQPSILVSTLSILAVLRKEFSVDLVAEHATVAAGHGSGVYASLVASGALSLADAVRLLRHRGLVASHFVEQNKILFPEGCERPQSIYETWAFANAGSGKGAELLSTIGVDAGGVPASSLTSDGQVASAEASAQARASDRTTEPTADVQQHRGWKRSQMSGFMVRPGKLQAVIDAVKDISAGIKRGDFPDVARDEVVEIANVNSSLQVVLSGTRVGVSHASDKLRALGLGARAVNLPVSGPYHSSIMSEASEFLKPLVEHMPLAQPKGLELVSSMDGSIMRNVDEIRRDLSGALQKPVMWLDSIQTMLASGVQRFVCLGPGRACAHLLSKELAHQDRLRVARGEKPSDFEVWSITSTEDIEQIGTVLNALAAENARTISGGVPVDGRAESHASL